MMRITADINKKYIDLNETDPVDTVTCFTCHRSQPEPPKNTLWGN